MVKRVVGVSENLGMKVNIKKTEMQHMGRVHKDFNIVVKNQNLKQSTLSIWEETSVHFRHQEADRDSEGCIPGTRKGLVSKRHNDNNKITSTRDTCLELPSLQL